MKLKMMVVTGLICSGILAGTASSVMADGAPQNVITGSEDGKGATSHGHINLTAGDGEGEDGSTEPTKPTIPPGETGNKGDLTLDNVAPLLFDTHKLEGKEQVYTSIVTDSNIQVTDKRGEEAGWHVQVTQTPFTDVVDNTKVLKGAKLVLPVGILEDTGNVSLSPETYSVEVNDEAATLMNATKGSGAGTWTSVFNKDQIKLTIPAGNKTGEYMSTVTWALMNAPK
ncbi:conserved exported hypothetical protein [Carnobacterium maltaromaticum]|uniref:WxL domain-containing protein n=1 Tax=Carnobacterium maltaromaticum TaxID=2751 RepID=A0AAW9K090_CARML|nr:WxL domain-containing protein [Carnobacterium maltaromaticum]MDZ5759285.1 WxL domain-containing protein [Carnobacterium maltaromaticum]CAD5897172.1 conserved exported hypothetical protein [Carnobacterium maltaromaticum]CAD5898852.1 conserved exported hypothetical protein [Carnobacterium maltaromaticum]